MTTCFFTASGNSLYVAQRIGGNLLSIPQLMRQDKIEIEDDAVGIVCPVYVAELPMMVSEFMKKAEIKTDYLFVVLTCGESFETALGHAELAAQARGWDIKYGNGVKMVYNYLPLHDMEEEIAKLPEKDEEGQISKVLADLAERKNQKVVITPELKKQMEFFHNEYATKLLDKNSALDYYVTDYCVRCAFCSKVCPSNNIKVTGLGVKFFDHCEVCYACVHNCPMKAIHLKNERSGARFRNPHLMLKDIIKANE